MSQNLTVIFPGTVGAMMGLARSKFLPAAPLKNKVHSDLSSSVDMVRLFDPVLIISIN